jgi:ketosteroid isomerase-like protein
VASENVERIREAAEAYNRGDVEPLVAMLDEDVDWRGPTSGHLWWRHTPSCHGPKEARANFERRLKQASLRPGYAGLELEDVQESGDRVMLGSRWRTEEGQPPEDAERFFQVVTMRDGKIVDIKGCKSHKEALRRLAKPTGG